MLRARMPRLPAVSLGLLFLLGLAGADAGAQAPPRSGPPPKQGPPPRVGRAKVAGKAKIPAGAGARPGAAPPRGGNDPAPSAADAEAEADAEIARRKQEALRASMGPGAAASGVGRSGGESTAVPPVDGAQAAYDLGQAYERQGQVSAAILAYREAIAAGPEGGLAAKARARIATLSPAGSDPGGVPFGDLLTPAQVADLRRTPPLAVLDVKDGDRVRIYRDGRAVTIQLAGIVSRDAEASGLARRPSDHLRALLKGRTVYVVPVGEAEGGTEPQGDGPVLAHIYRTSDGLWINRTMAADGFATATEGASASLKAAEAGARKARIGRWAVRP